MILSWWDAIQFTLFTLLTPYPSPALAFPGTLRPVLAGNIRANWSERVLGNTRSSIATLEPEQKIEAARIGLLPAKIAETEAVIVAYRSAGTQGLMTIAAERYDGMKLLELFDGG